MRTSVSSTDAALISIKNLFFMNLLLCAADVMEIATPRRFMVVLDILQGYETIEEQEEPVDNRPIKIYASILVKAVNGFDQLYKPYIRTNVSSLAWFMSYQETSFVTLGQRILENLLK
uniref:Uncharacterized protein n=1 Tax=Lactuca sativa TaxID=4236 RepID=A0A9R1UIU0_LACSA|nr:hypothetical protein LSAT_V11C900496730 [Lactuca sativa]